MLSIFIDTNVLIHSSEFKVNIQEQLLQIIFKKFQVVIHPLVFSELLEKAQNNTKTGKLAKLGLQLTYMYETYEDTAEYPGTDIALLIAAKREHGAVLTFDKELKNRCKQANVPVIYLKRGGQLMVVGFIH